MTVDEAYAAIRDKDGEIHAFLEVFGGESGGSGPLAGLPIAVKDVLLVNGKTASAGSKILENYRATYDATAVRKLKEAGAAIVGRTNCDEFAMGSSTENSAYGPTKNPVDLSRVPGGSSGGSAAAVAAGMCWGALGSDTGGSVRQPASFCGVVGFKPTYGAVSRYGLIAMASSLDQVGVFAKTVTDTKKIFDIISGSDTMDATSARNPKSMPRRQAGEIRNPKQTRNLKIGALKYDRSGVDDDVNGIFDESAKRLGKLGHTVREVELESLKYALPCYYIIMFAEVSTNLARFDGVRYGLHVGGANLLEDYMFTKGAGFGAEAKRRIILGTYVLSAGYYDAYYGRAQAVRARIIRDTEALFRDVDFLLTPTSPTPAFKLGEKTNDPLQMYLADIFTVSANIAGIPGISVPAGKSREGLPIGMQLMGPRWSDDGLLGLADQFEHAA